MKASMKKAKAAAKPLSRRVIPISASKLQDHVTSIGFRTDGVMSADRLKMDFMEMKNHLGGKGAGLAEMARLGIPVPPAINLSTELCGIYLAKSQFPEAFWAHIRKAIQGLEKTLGRKLGSSENPLLLSVRSGARVSMPGMMDTILNLGLNAEITQKLADTHPDRARFWWDCYRRFIQMFSDVVLNVDHSRLEDLLADVKIKHDAQTDADLTDSVLKKLCEDYLQIIRESGKTFPEDPWDQLRLASEAVFRSWNTDRAIGYRKLNKISDEWGTAVTIQSMVFGNLNDKSATGVVFTRNPSTGANEVYGEYLVNAQGEDVVAGIRTPHHIADMKAELPRSYAALEKVLSKLERHFNEVQDVEFTIENDRLFVLQTRTAKRTAAATLENAVQFVREKKLKPNQALQRLSYDNVKQLLHPTLKASGHKAVGRGLPASPGAASGRIAFDPERAISLAKSGQKAILVRRETSPEDIMGMAAAEGILTATGGMTSHAAVVGRGMGKCCVVGCSDLQIDEAGRRATVNGVALEEEAWITLNGSTGEIFLGQLPTEPMTWGKTADVFFGWADDAGSIPVFANADTPDQAQDARRLGARGIGLCRTEHMFFEAERIRKFRLMILSENESDRKEASENLKEFQRQDFEDILRVMEGFPVTVRLLDPPLHEFLPAADKEEEVTELASELGTTSSRLIQRIYQLHETNPMLGHRGCRLGITFPEIYEMQVRALAQSLHQSLKKNVKAFLKIMIPLTMSSKELRHLLQLLKSAYEDEIRSLTEGEPKLAQKIHAHTKWGTMIELPRACLIASEIAPMVDFISFGTNDLTQTTFGISRDDAAKFIPAYVEKGILTEDPFESIDQQGVGRLVALAVDEGRKANSKLDVGVCGEHGGDPTSIGFFHKLGFNSVSCSPFRVPMARLAVARSSLDSKVMQGKKKKR